MQEEVAAGDGVQRRAGGIRLGLEPRGREVRGAPVQHGDPAAQVRKVREGGRSFVKLDMFGHYRYGSELLNVVFDPTRPREASSGPFDDAGSPAERQHLIRDGVLLRPIGGRTSQLRAAMPGVACARASGWNRPAINRIGVSGQTAKPAPPHAGLVKPPATDAEKIRSAMSAAPPAIAREAAVVDMPSMKELRKGTNGWTCIPDGPSPGVDPMCVDKNDEASGAAQCGEGVGNNVDPDENGSAELTPQAQFMSSCPRTAVPIAAAARISSPVDSRLRPCVSAVATTSAGLASSATVARTAWTSVPKRGPRGRPEAPPAGRPPRSAISWFPSPSARRQPVRPYVPPLSAAYSAIVPPGALCAVLA